MVGTRSTSQALASGLGKETSTPAPRRAAGGGGGGGATATTTAAAAAARWAHAPTTATLAWLAVSLPLVTWDTGYVLGRPATMPGGWAHLPLYAPYELYGRVDHMYGFKQWDAGNGFTAAQGMLNVVETVMYLVYLWLWHRNGVVLPAGAGAGRRVVAGRAGALAVLFGFSAAVMTVSKTVLYWLNEAASGFDNIGHNAPLEMLTLWIIPK